MVTMASEAALQGARFGAPRNLLDSFWVRST